MTADDLSPPPPDLTDLDGFIQQVRNLLEHLYDFPYLQKHPLVVGRAGDAQPRITAPGGQVRKYLIDAIEQMSGGADKPGGKPAGGPFRSSQSRIYHILRYRYIEGMTVQEIARELDLSLRQAYRDLRYGDEFVASYVLANLAESPAAAGSIAAGSSTAKGSSTAPDAFGLAAVHPPTVPGEAVPESAPALPEPTLQPVALQDLIESAYRTVAPLAERRGVRVALDLPDHPVTILTDRMVARQVVTLLLSQAVQQALPGSVTARLSDRGGDYLLTAAYPAALPEGAASPPAPWTDPTLEEYTRTLDWQIRQEVRGETAVIEVLIGAHYPRFLLIDDNQAFLELVERYVSPYNARMIFAPTGQEGVELAQQLAPDLIILDVMMPEMDGWEILQRLRAHPATKSIPVIVCSVFYDPELAFSLGASASLKKPLRKEELVGALRKVL